MSTYQYYEFQAIDRPLTQEEQRAVSQLSSRVELHPRRAVFKYSFGGSLPRRAEDVLVDYYDAMLYLATWGSRQLMFRFPRALVDTEKMRQYNIVAPQYPPDAIGVSTRGEHVILNIRLAELKALAGHEDETWRQVDVLIQRSQAKAYEEAVRLLTKLQGLAEYQGRQSAFEVRLDRICDQYSRRRALMRLFREAGLIDP